MAGRDRPPSGAYFVSSEVYRAAGYGAQHPLGIPRIGTVVDICEAMGWLNDHAIIDSPQATVDELLKFHDARYVEALRAAEQSGKVSRAA